MIEVEYALSIEHQDPEQAMKIYQSIASQDVKAEEENKIKEIEIALVSMGIYS